MAHATKVERTHNAAKAYLSARGAGDIDLRAFFAGVTDENLSANLASIVGAVARATAGKLAFDASAPELHKKLKQAVEADGTAKNETSGVDDDVINKVMALLEMRLTPTELQAVKAILMQQPKGKGSQYDPANLSVEDSRNAQVAFDQRFPSASRIKIEPSNAPAPQRHQSPPANPSSYFERFPDAKRIGVA